MKKAEFETKMNEHEKAFKVLWDAISKDVNEFIKDNPDSSYYPFTYGTAVDHFKEDLIFSGAWIEDRINGYSGFPEGQGYKKSLTKKIRKALGYNI